MTRNPSLRPGIPIAVSNIGVIVSEKTSELLTVILSTCKDKVPLVYTKSRVFLGSKCLDNIRSACDDVQLMTLKTLEIVAETSSLVIPK